MSISCAITAFVYQYNNSGFLERFKCRGIRYSSNFSFIIGMIPYAVAGFLISYSEICKYLKKIRLTTIISLIYFLFFLLNHEIFKTTKCFYCGLHLFFVSISVFIIFAMFPSEKINNIIIIRIIKIITKYTAGIYLLHHQIGYYISNYISYVKQRSLKGCIIIYLLCYLICFFGIIFFGKTKLRHLFE